MELLRIYYEMFKKIPPISVGVSYETEEYKNALKKAIERRKPITQEELDELFENEDLNDYDLKDEFDANEDGDFDV